MKSNLFDFAVTDALNSVKALSIVTTKADDAAKAIPGILDVVYYDAIGGIADWPSNDFIVDIWTRGLLTSVADFTNAAFKITTTMPDIATDLQKRIIPIILATKYQGQGATAVKNLNTVLATDWSKKSGSATVRAGFIAIQGYMKKELQTTLSNLNRDMKVLDDVLNKFQLRKYNIEWNTQSIYYGRFVNTEFSMPCLRTMTQSWTLGQYKESADYPTFYECSSGHVYVNLPIIEIPTIKWRWIAR